MKLGGGGFGTILGGNQIRSDDIFWDVDPNSEGCRIWFADDTNWQV